MVATQSFPRGKKQPPAAAAAAAAPAKSAKKRKHDDAGAALEVDEDQDTGADALFGKKGVAAKSADASAAAAAVKKTKKVVKKPKVDADKDLKEPKEATATAITFKSLRKGALLLGCVRQINDGELLISLPNKLNGIVTAAECSDEFFAYYEKQQDKKQKKRPGIAVPGASFGATKDAEEEEEPAVLSSIFQVGQFVPCVVLSASKESKGKQIYLSLRTSLLHAELLPQTVNKGMTLHGTVASVEDHGAIINLGVRGLNAFVPLKELKTSEITPVKGQHMFVNVLSMNSHTSTATVTPDRSQVVKAVTRGDSFTVKQLVPGMLLNVRVEEVLKNGLSVNFLTFFNATVEQNHMSNPCHLGWEESYKKGLKGRARIISIDFVSKQITLSMAPHVVHLAVTEPSFTIGDIINEATIERIDEGIGMLLSLQKASANGSDMDVDEEADAPTKATWKTFTPAYVHISNVSDNRVDKLEKKFTVGTKIPARVIGFAPFDGLVNVSCKESSLSQTVLRHADLVAGEKLTGTIIKIEPWGILLELSEGVRGVVSPQHVPPFVSLKKTGKKGDSSGKYQVGKKVEARVLRVDMESKKTYLTMKKTLLTSEIPVLASYEDATMGRVAQGYITKIAEYGVVVSFYNGVYGLVPAALLHQAGVVNLEEAYVLGQVVKAVVTRCDVGKKRLMLTFNAAASSSVKASSGASSQEKSELIGKTVKNVKVLDVEATCLRVQTEDGLEGVLPFVQLTDFPRQTALVDELVKQYEAGDVIQEPLLVVSESKDSVLTFSKKPLLMQYAGKSAVLPSSFSDIKEHAVLLGFVASVNAAKGVFIKFLNNLTALAPKAFLSDKFMADIEDGLFEMGETVLCHVEKIEKDKQQFVVGFRRHQELLAGVKDMSSFFQSYLREYTTATNVEAPYTLGKTEKAEFLGMRPYGAVFALEKGDETTTVIVRDVKDSEWEEGDNVKLLLVDYDFEKNVYFGSTDSALVKNGSKKARKQKNRLSAGAKIENATVIAVGPTEKYVVVSFADPQDKDLVQFGVVQVADFWCPSQSSSALDLDIGSSIACRLLKPSLSFAKKTPFDDLPLLAREEEGLLTKTKKKKERAPRAEGETVTLPKYKSEDLVLGKILTGRIAVIKENSMEIKVKTSHTCGKVVATVSIVDVDEDKDHSHPFDRFSVNMLVGGRILAVLEKGANQRKPVSESNPANFHALHLSLRKEDLDAEKSVKELVRADWQENSAGRALLRNGKSIDGVVVEQSEDGLTVKLSHRVVGYLNALELSNDLDVLREFREKFPVGKRVRCNILNVDEDKNRVDLSIVRLAQLAFKPGSVVNGLITTKVSAAKPPSIMVCLAGQTFGRVCVTELLPRSQWKNDMHKLPQFAAGKFVKCVVLSSNGNNIDLSLRQDALDDPAAYIKAPVDEHKVNDLVTAIVVSTTSSGCFLRVGRQTSARVMLRDLSDNFIKDPQAEFQPGKLVAGRVVKKSNRGLELSLKASIVSEDVAVLKFKDLKEGMTVKGTITKVQAYGVFVKIEKSTISGLCHISEIADEKVTQSLDQVFTEGDYVKAKILKIEDLRVSFGLKPSYFEGEESSSEEEDDDEEEESEDEEEGAEKMEVDEDNDDEEESEDEEEVAPKAAKRAPPVKVESMDVDEESTSSGDDEPAASAQVGFTWDGFANVLDHKKSNNNDDDSSDDEDDEEANAASKSSKKKTKQNDEWVALREKALASNDEVPQSADDYERLIAVSPQSSFLWIQYMAFHVSLTEIDMARDVAIRATSAVSFRDEKEKLNVWVAYMNLEHDFGDEAAFLRVFNSALKVNHQKRVYLHLVDLYARAQEDDDVEQTLTTMQKKFRKSKQTWLRALQYQVSQKQFGKAAETLQKSLKSLEAHKHLPVILKYGQLMYENGELEKARTIFEGILANYPKRMDLWNVYLDKEIKFGTNVDLVRALFERLIAMDFSAKKMKFLFKKYLQYEQEHGDDDSVEHVKQLAKDFVAQAAAGK
uniref:rRNA biogenesis protein RRP5 n=1 Tax=Globisporangium ultimum (strain ATCC 200006 / CBS 805.95 / DAOM BR144) TaxID=431595 RepID=K3WWJ4_GLOUD